MRDEAANMLRRVELMASKVERALDAARAEVELVWAEAGNLYRRVAK